ncbi:unnamed protein product [Allacma fusca]|uniref:Uncharacterized protein n=1 Tax=Allacma fusca TaxID=39272 RepID=A0A8J2MAH5_9HEXA|nr:unnamed protein product [Allacma fusca]
MIAAIQVVAQILDPRVQVEAAQTLERVENRVILLVLVAALDLLEDVRILLRVLEEAALIPDVVVLCSDALLVSQAWTGSRRRSYERHIMSNHRHRHQYYDEPPSNEYKRTSHGSNTATGTTKTQPSFILKSVHKSKSQHGESARRFSENERTEKPRPTRSIAPFTDISQSKEVENYHNQKKDRDTNALILSHEKSFARSRSRDRVKDSPRRVEVTIQTTRKKRSSRVSRNEIEYYGMPRRGPRTRPDSRQKRSHSRHGQRGNPEMQRLSTGGESRDGYWYWGRNSRGQNSPAPAPAGSSSQKDQYSKSKPRSGNNFEDLPPPRPTTPKPKYYGESNRKHSRPVITKKYATQYESPYRFQKEDLRQSYVAYNEFRNRQKFFPSMPTSRTDISPSGRSIRKRKSSNHKVYTLEAEDSSDEMNDKYTRNNVKESGTVTGKTPHRAFDYPWLQEFNYKKHYNKKRNNLQVYLENKRKHEVPRRSDRWRT